MRTDRHPLRIEMVLPSLVTGGMEAVVARLGQALAARGLDVGFTLTVDEGDFAVQLRNAGFEVCLVPQPHRLASVRVGTLQARLASRQPDIVHVHSGVWLRAARAAARAKVGRVLHTIHGLLNHEPWQGPILKRIAMHYTDEVVAVSPSLADYLCDRVGIDRARVQVIANGVDTARFRPVTRQCGLREAFGIPAHAIVVGTVARLDPIKNQALILDALPKLLASGGDYHVLIVGDGHERQSLGERAEALGITSRVHFAGVQLADATLYAELDIFALPSILEGTSISLLEAMACSIPVVATDVGGTTSVLERYPYPGLIRPQDVDGFVDACFAVERDSQSRSAAGAWLRHRVDEKYSESAMVQRYLDVYERLSSNSTLRRS